MKTTLSILCCLVLVGCIRSQAPQIMVDLSPTGQLFLADSPVSIEELLKHFRREHRRHGSCPVVIRSVGETRHTHIRVAMDVALSAGHWEITFSDGNGSTAEFPNYVHMWEPEESEGGAVPEGCVGVTVSTEGWNTNMLALATSNTKVAILCTPDSKHVDLITALRTCKAMNVSTVFVGTVWMNKDDLTVPLKTKVN